MRVLSPTGVGIGILATLLAVSSALFRASPEDLRAQQRVAARATAQAERTATISARATEVARHCTSSERVVVSARLHPPPGQTDQWYYAVGTVRNTCNFPLQLRLDIDGLSPGLEESVAAARPELNLAAHEERHFVEVLAPFHAGRLDRLTIQPRIWPEARDGEVTGNYAR